MYKIKADKKKRESIFEDTEIYRIYYIKLNTFNRNELCSALKLKRAVMTSSEVHIEG